MSEFFRYEGDLYFYDDFVEIIKERDALKTERDDWKERFGGEFIEVEELRQKLATAREALEHIDEFYVEHFSQGDCPCCDYGRVTNEIGHVDGCALKVAHDALAKLSSEGRG